MRKNLGTLFGSAVLLASAFAVLAPATAEAQQGPYQFFAVTPCRTLDTRQSTKIPAGGSRNFTIKNTCGVPGTAKAVAVNVTVTQADGDGDLRFYPVGVAAPQVSTINFKAGETGLANGAIVPVATGSPDLTTTLNMIGGAGTHLILDINGYFQ